MLVLGPGTFYVEAAGMGKAIAAGERVWYLLWKIPCGGGENDPFFLPAASSLTQRLVVESLMLPVVPQTTSYKPLPTFVEGSTPGILKSNNIYTFL